MGIQSLLHLPCAPFSFSHGHSISTSFTVSTFFLHPWALNLYFIYHVHLYSFTHGHSISTSFTVCTFFFLPWALNLYFIYRVHLFPWPMGIQSLLHLPCAPFSFSHGHSISTSFTVCTFFLHPWAFNHYFIYREHLFLSPMGTQSLLHLPCAPFSFTHGHSFSTSFTVSTFFFLPWALNLYFIYRVHLFPSPMGTQSLLHLQCAPFSFTHGHSITTSFTVSTYFFLPWALNLYFIYRVHLFPSPMGIQSLLHLPCAPFSFSHGHSISNSFTVSIFFLRPWAFNHYFIYRVHLFPSPMGTQ